MREFFIAFRSRSEAMRFHEAMISYRLPSKLINTPSSAQVGCGLSVKMFERDMNRAKTVLSRGGFDSAIGIYFILSDGSVRRI